MKKPQGDNYKHIPTLLPKILFTPNQLVFLQKALVALEQMLLAAQQPFSNAALTLLTITEVQAKIITMMQQSATNAVVAFDENEVLILRAAVWVFASALDAIEPSPEGEELKKGCQVLIAMFNRPLQSKHRHD